MGEQIGKAVEGRLYHAAPAEFDRLRRLNVPAAARAALFADLARLNALYMIANAGSGHVGSSFSSLDLVAWLHLEEKKDDDVYFSSKGHDAPGLYSVLIALGRLPADLLHALRRRGGLPGHPDVSLPHLTTNTGSLGMGISKAKGMIEADRLLGRDRRVFVMTGDGELQEGQIWESLQGAANRRMGALTAIVDHNKLQSDFAVSATSDLGDLEAKFAAFGWAVERVDGHDFVAIAAALERLNRVTDRPKAMIADTIKGRGVSFMEQAAQNGGGTPYPFHSGAPDAATYSRAVQELIERINGALEVAAADPLSLETRVRPAGAPADARVQRLVPAYSDALMQEGRRNKRIVVLDADLALDTGVLPFRQAFPGRFVECGIAEMDMVSQAGGMALSGLLPVCHSFACFLSARPNEQIYNNATERTKVVYVGALAGVVPGGPGHSHQAVRDIAALGGIPDFIMAEPSCAEEVAPLLDYCLNEATGSSYLRLVSIPWAVTFELPADYRPAPGTGCVLHDGADAVLISYGMVMLSEAYRAAEMLRKQGVGLRIVNLPWLNRVDQGWLRSAVADCGHVFTLDNHQADTGQGAMIARAMAESGIAGGRAVRRFGLSEVPVCGTNEEVLAHHGLHAAGLVRVIADAVSRSGASGAGA